MSRKRIGELLLERRAITPEQLEAGLVAQQRTRQRLGVTLVQQGLISEVQLAIVLGQSLGLGSVDLSKVQVDWSAVHMLRARFCENHEVFPFGIEGKGTANKKLLVAMSDPLNQGAIQEIEFTTGLQPSIRVATHAHVREAILRYYHKVSAPDGAVAKPLLTPGAAGTGSVKLRPAPPAEAEVVVGQEILSGPNPMPPVSGDPTLERLISERPKQLQAQKKLATATVAKDLDFLFGSTPEEGEALEQLEKKVWVLLRLMARKGLITREEFLKELESDE
jgi:hypothetical protein